MKEELRDSCKNLELYRSKVYIGELKHIELQRENQALRHKVNQYRKLVTEIQRFQKNPTLSDGLSRSTLTEAFPGGHTTSAMNRSGAAHDLKSQHLPIQLRTDGIDGKKYLTHQSLETAKNELQVIRSLQTQISSEMRSPGNPVGTFLSIDTD